VLVKDAFQVTLPGGQIIIEVNLKISKILMKKEMEPEDAWVEVPIKTDLLQPFNLLELNNVAMLAAIGSVPSGEYEKVRMVLDQSFAPCIVLQANPSVCEPLKVPSHKIDIQLKPHVLVPEGGTTSIVLDFVPDKSIHINDTGSSEKYILRPVIRAVTAELPEGIRAHNEITGVVTGCTENTLELSLPHRTVHVTIHYDGTTQFFSDEHAEDSDETHTPLSSVACSDLSGKRVEVKVLALPDGSLHAVRVEIKGEVAEIEEFQVTGTLAANSSLTLHTLTSGDYTVNFPEGTVRVEGRLTGDQSVLAREIETLSVAEDFEVMGFLDPPGSTLSLTDEAGVGYTIAFPPRPIKVEGILDAETNTITAREIEVFP
jgi:hypothetical protein